MLITLKGIVIGQRNVGENSRFLDILTEEFGVIEVTANAVKKINSKNAGSTALFTYSKFCLNKSSRSGRSAYSINSAEPVYSFHKLSADFTALSLAAYFAELLKYTSASEQNAGNLLRFFAISLYELERSVLPPASGRTDFAVAAVKSVFELKLAQILGFTPDLIACADCFCYEHDEMYFEVSEGRLLCNDCFSDVNGVEQACFVLKPPLLHAMRFIVFTQPEKVYKFNLNEKHLRELGFITEEYLLYHLGRKFKTLEYYKKLTKGN
ncbi:MAG: DNA repair protein RecO [Oscillospiraceae bacterium]|nr:DNA repair protein RecO [Oscillospiraceae bacterium]